MATKFKSWFQGRPLEGLLPNDSNLTYWAEGRPLPTFEKVVSGVATPDTNSLVCTPLSVTVTTTYKVDVVIDSPLSLTISPIGFLQEEIRVEAIGSTVIYNYPPEIEVEAVGVTVIYREPGNITAQPTTLHGVLTPLPPTIVTYINVIVSAPLVSLTLTPLSTTVGTGVSITEVLHLVLTPSDPTIKTGLKVSVSTQHLYLSQYVPTGVRVQLSTLHISILKHDPVVPQPTIATPTTLALTLTSFDVTAGTGAYIAEPLHLTFTANTPQTSGQANCSASLLHLICTLQNPSIGISTTQQPNTLPLVISALDVLVGTGAHIEKVLHLLVTPETVLVSATQVLTQEILHLLFTLHSPSPGPALTYVDDILHKERDWAAEFTHANAEYADRAGASLSPGFPLNTGSSNFTICLWFRLKSFAGSFQSLLTKTSCFSLGIESSWMTMRLYYVSGLGVLTYDNCTLFTEDNDLRLQVGRWYHLGVSVENITGKVYAQLWDDFEKRIVSARDFHNGIFSQHPPYRYAISDFTIGSDPTITGSFFDGYIDEVIIFNEVRSPMEMDRMRKGGYNGQLEGYTVSENALATGYTPSYKILAEAAGQCVGYNEALERKVSTAGLMVGYIVPAPPVIPPPPVIGGLAGGGAGEGSIDFCHLSYKFKTDVYAHDYNSDSEGRFDNFTFPTEHLEASLGSSDQGAYFHMMSVLRSGASIFSVPIWALRTTITDNARAGQTIVTVTDISNFNIGEGAILMRASDTGVFDLITITGITSNSILFDVPLEHHYHPFRMPSVTKRYDERSSYIAPCITGIVDIEDHGLRSPRPFYFVKVKVDGGVWVAAEIDPEVPIFTEVPLSAAYVAPRIEKTVAGAEAGILELMPHFSTSRFAFEIEWTFIDNTWQDLRTLFFAVKGRVKPFYMPTWVFELTALADAVVGALQIQLHSGYSEIYPRFTRIFVMSGRNSDRFAVNITGSLGGNLYSCEPLTHNIYRGDKACFYPQVRFLEDELIFEFHDIGKCAAKVSFIEVLA